MSSKLLINSEKGHVSASQRIPPIALPYVSDRAQKTLDIVSQHHPQFSPVATICLIWAS